MQTLVISIKPILRVLILYPALTTVDNASGYQYLNFMDAYSGYNQIKMHPDDEEK